VSERDVDVLLNVDRGYEVQYDGQPPKTAVAYFEQLCAGSGVNAFGKRDPRVIVNWYM